MISFKTKFQSEYFFLKEYFASFQNKYFAWFMFLTCTTGAILINILVIQCTKPGLLHMGFPALMWSGFLVFFIENFYKDNKYRHSEQAKLDFNLYIMKKEQNSFQKMTRKQQIKKNVIL